jgi:glutamine amidotransferase
VQETNCHPFRHGNWLFVHNGEIFEIEKFRKRLVEAVADELFTEMLGTTDSEVMFYLALTFGLESDPPGALARMAGFVERTGAAHGVDEALWMTVGVTDGRTLHTVRYASDGRAPTLYYTRDVEDVYRLNPELRGRFSPTTRLVASEPTGDAKGAWVEAPQGSYVRVCEGKVEVRPFAPAGRAAGSGAAR